MVPTLLVTAPDLVLPGMLKAGGLAATFVTTSGLGSAIKFKTGALVLVVDENQVPVLLESSRHDLRAVAVVSPGAVPVVFPFPVIAVVERPLDPSKVLPAIRKAWGTLEVGG